MDEADRPGIWVEQAQRLAYSRISAPAACDGSVQTAETFPHGRKVYRKLDQ